MKINKFSKNSHNPLKDFNMHIRNKKNIINSISIFLSPVIAILFAFILAGLVVLISGGNPLNAYSSLIKGAFGSLSGLKNTLRFTLPIIFLALSFSITARCGLFNIGQDGQLIASALTVVSIPVFFPNISEFSQVLIMVLLGALAGAFVALIPTLLKIWLGINEVVVAILLNYLLINFSSYILAYTALGNPNSSYIMSNRIQPTLSPSIIIMTALLVVLGYALTLRFSVPGYHLRMVGKNYLFARSSGIKATKIIISASLIGGALSGLVAVGELLGVYHIMYDGFITGMGNNGIMAAIIGQNSPLGMILSSMVLGSLQSGSVLLSVATDVPAEIVIVVQGFVMLFATVSVKSVINRFRGNNNGS